MAQNGHFGAITGSVGSELVEQCGIKVEQVRAHPGQCNGTVSLVRGGYWGPKRVPNGPKWSFCSHKGVLWLRTGGTVWNIGGTSQGTSGAIQWNRFSGQGCLWGATRSAYGPKMLFLAVLDPFWGPLAHPDGPH